MANSSWVGISIISKLEFLSFSGIKKSEIKYFEKFIKRIFIVALEKHSLKNQELIIAIRKKYKVKLPDAIIAAAAILNNAILITNDKKFKKIKELKLQEIRPSRFAQKS